MKYRFSFFNIQLISDIIFPELQSAEKNNAGISFEISDTLKKDNNDKWTCHWYMPSGQILSSYKRDTNYHWLSFPGIADFKINVELNDITCYKNEQVPIETIRHLVLDQVLPRLLSQRDRLILHASVVLIEGSLLLFLGMSGTGKSTLAGAFHNAGYPALCDDCVWLKEEGGQVIASPSYPGLRLWGDAVDVLFRSEQSTQRMAHYSNKQRIKLLGPDPAVYQSGVPLLGVILLQPSNDPGTPVHLQLQGLRQGYLSIIKQLFFLDQDDITQLQAKMHMLAEIAPKIKIWRLNYPRDYAQLPMIQDLILKTV